MNIAETIKYVLEFDDHSLFEFAQIAHTNYKRYKINKKNGGKRVIYHPTAKVKSIQYIIKSVLLDELIPSDIAVGYRKDLKSPLKIIAEGHKNYNYAIRIDFKDFFPSLKFSDFKNSIESNYLTEISENEWDLLKFFLFINENGDWFLPIGSPTSPVISNIILKTIDERIRETSKKIDPDSHVTRYADDIVFSTNKKDTCKLFLDEFKKLINSIVSPKLTLNDSKTAFMSKGNKKLINGIVITPDRKISLGRHYKRFIRKCVFDYLNRKLTLMTVNQLAGHLSYIRDIEKAFYNSLYTKYGSEISNIKVIPSVKPSSDSPLVEA